MRKQSFFYLMGLLCMIYAQLGFSGDLYYPSTAGWQRVEPQSAQIEQKTIDQALQVAGQYNSHAVVILHDGRILAEQYWSGHDQESRFPVYSASKSVVSVLTGIAIEQGSLRSVMQSAATFLPEWQNQRDYRHIKIKHLLSMTSGLKGGKRIFTRGLKARDQRGFATDLPAKERPGRFWEYHQSAYRLLFPILKTATNQPLQSFSQQTLFDRIGMLNTEWKRRRVARSQLSHLEMSARDAARFGLLMLSEGLWENEQIVSARWVLESTSPAFEDLNPSFGYLWWLNGGDFHYQPLNPVKKGKPMFAGCPEDTFAALGKNDQRIYIVPSLSLVVVRFGEATEEKIPTMSEFDTEFLCAFTQGVESSL